MLVLQPKSRPATILGKATFTEFLRIGAFCCFQAFLQTKPAPPCWLTQRGSWPPVREGSAFPQSCAGLQRSFLTTPLHRRRRDLAGRWSAADGARTTSTGGCTCQQSWIRTELKAIYSTELCCVLVVARTGCQGKHWDASPRRPWGNAAAPSTCPRTPQMGAHIPQTSCFGRTTQGSQHHSWTLALVTEAQCVMAELWREKTHRLHTSSHVPGCSSSLGPRPCVSAEIRLRFQ